jgi:hypothetical protein
MFNVIRNEFSSRSRWNKKQSVKSIKYTYDIAERMMVEHDASRATASPSGD